MVQENEELFNLFKNSFIEVLDRINDPIIVVNKDGNVVYVNEAYEYQVGISRERILGKNLYRKYPNDKLLQVLKTGQLIEGEEHFNETLGYNIVASFMPLKDAEGQTSGVIGVGNLGCMNKLYKHLRAPSH